MYKVHRMTKYAIFSILIAAFLTSTPVIISNTIHHASAALPDWNFAAAGDWGCTVDAVNTVNNMVNKDPELVLGLGDFSYTNDTADCWFDITQPIDSKMKIVIGNHDEEHPTLLNELKNHFNLDTILSIIRMSTFWHYRQTFLPSQIHHNMSLPKMTLPMRLQTRASIG
jgi:hypothetical protein